MKALSVRQPWASLIAAGRKRLEIRPWQTRYRGPLLIVASRRPHEDLPTGVALAVVDVADCRPFRPEDAAAAGIVWRSGLWAWVLADPRPTPPIPVRGRLGLYEVPDGRLSA